MGTFTYFVFAWALIATSYADRSSVEELTSYNYHLKVGIPSAARIKRYEENAEKNGQPGHKIAGGSVTDISEVPYQAGLIILILNIYPSICGGSLISKNRVLSAAHCQDDGFFSATSQTIVLGSNTIFSGGLRLTTSEAIVHPGWNPETTENDIAVIRIPNIEFTDVIQPIALPSEEDISESFAHKTALASGFGINADFTVIAPNQVLYSVDLEIITNAECADAHGDYVHNTNICISGAEGKSTCSGDSGGPLVIQTGERKILVGATSYGSRLGCTVGYPVAFTRITSYLSWILSI